MQKIAIIGSGFFGSTCALILSKFFKVDLFEKKNKILCGASRANQMRFHLGYHYPRSLKTIQEVKKAKQSFIKFYGKNIFGNTKNYYGVSKIDSKINYKKYIKFLKKNNLKYKKIYKHDFGKLVEGSIISEEKNLNFFKIRKKILSKIKRSNIKLNLNTEFKKSMLKNYSKVIIAVYDQNNLVLKQLGFNEHKKYKFELVEKILIKLPKKFRNKSYMVIDGQFVCLDPYLGTKYHLLSHNKFSKIEVKKSKYPNFYNKKKRYLNSGLIKKRKISKYDKFIEDGSKYLPFLKDSKYFSSFFVTRAINLNKEKTDERINEIKVHKNKVITIFSGKWNTCVDISHQIKKIILNEK